MPVSEDFLEYLYDQFYLLGPITVRKMFGGAGIYHAQKIFGLVADDILYLKVDDANRDRFLQAGSSPFQPFPDKRETMSYYEIPPDVLENPEELVLWAKTSLAIEGKKKKRPKG
jgi:DNA transformation protein